MPHQERSSGTCKPFVSKTVAKLEGADLISQRVDSRPTKGSSQGHKARHLRTGGRNRVVILRLTSLPYKGHFAQPTASQRLELTSTIPSDFFECCWQNMGFPPIGPKKGRLRQDSTVHHRGVSSGGPSWGRSSSCEGPAISHTVSVFTFFYFRRKMKS